MRKVLIKELETAIKLQVIVKEIIKYIKRDKDGVNLFIAGVVTFLIFGGMVALYAWMPSLKAYFG